MSVVRPAQVKKLTFAIFEKIGAPPEAAEIISRYTVDSHLYGHDTHGLQSVPRYVNDMKAGKIDPTAQMEIVKNDPPTVLIDGHWGFGYVTAAQAMDVAIETAKQHGLAAVAVNKCNHVGMLWGYVKMAVDEGLIAIILCSSGTLAPDRGLVVPYGGTRRFLGANPLAWGLPAGEMKPLIMDMSTTVVAAGQVLLAQEKGEAIPEGWMVDEEGRPTTDPDALFKRGGALLPFGGHKGYGLSLLVEMMGGILAGFGCAYLPEYREGNGLMMLVLDVERFVHLEEFQRQADELFREIKKVPTDAQTTEILIPGELEFRAKEKRVREGIAIPDKTWQTITELAAELGINLVELLG